MAAPYQNDCLRYLMHFFTSGHLNQKDQEDSYDRVTCLFFFFGTAVCPFQSLL